MKDVYLIEIQIQMIGGKSYMKLKLQEKWGFAVQNSGGISKQNLFQVMGISHHLEGTKCKREILRIDS